MRTLIATLLPALLAADFKDVNPNVFPADDPRSKDMPRMVAADVKRRMQEANLRESKAFATVTTREQWEVYRDLRILALRQSLGTFPAVPKDMRIVVTGKLDGDGYRIHNLVYETRPGLWANANLYLPADPPAKMPGIVIVHSHHTPNTQGELQDMGMTWARAGVAVLVPELLGHGERRQHDFRTAKDYPKPFKPDRQDYYFRYNANLQLSAIGDALMGWFVWDLMRGIDVLLKQPTIDRDRIILLGAVAGGGDPAGVTAALDPRIACVVPFNFGGWQPESRVLENPDRDFEWFGEGYWESTRGLRGGAAGGFAHYVITGSLAPRRLIHAHEFAWDAPTDPAWPRLQKIFGFYDAKDRLTFAHGAGKVSGPGGPDNTHCTHIGAVHRKMIYPALKEWFGMPIPEEYSKRRTSDELLCWTDEAKRELMPRQLHQVLMDLAEAQQDADRVRLTRMTPGERRDWLRREWTRRLGPVEPPADTKLIEGTAEAVPDGKLLRFAVEVEPGIVVPFALITPNRVAGKSPVVVMVAQGGKAGFLKDRGDALAAFLKAGVAVCLVDVRGIGETRPGDGSPGRTGSRTSISQTEQILGRTVLGNQLRDVRAVVRWLQSRPEVDGKKLAVWGDSFAEVNSRWGTYPRAPLDAPDLPGYAEPGGAMLAALAAFYEEGVQVVYARGGLPTYRHLLWSPYLYMPHDAVVPGAMLVGDLGFLFYATLPRPLKVDGPVDEVNGWHDDPSYTPMRPAAAAAWVVKQLNGK